MHTAAMTPEPPSMTVGDLIELLEDSPSLDLPVYISSGPDDSEETGAITYLRVPIDKVMTIRWGEVHSTGPFHPAYVRIDGRYEGARWAPPTIRALLKEAILNGKDRILGH